MNNTPEFMTVREAAKKLNKKVRTIRSWIYSGKLDAVKDSNGYRWFIFADDVNRILEDEHAD